MIDTIKNMIGKLDLFDNFNGQRYDDNKEGDILLWYDRPQILYLTYFDKNYILSFYDDFEMEDDWVDIFLIEDVTGISKETLYKQLFDTQKSSSFSYCGVIIKKGIIIDYIEIL